MSFLDHPMSEGFYERLRPALHLATILLNNAQPFFMTIMTGKTYVHVDDNGKRWVTLQSLDPKSLTAAQYTQYDQGLKELAKITGICWLPSRFTGCCDELCGQCESLYLTFLGQINSRVVHRFSISSRAWQAFGDPHWKEASLEQKCYLWFHFTVTLVHEFAHVMWRERTIDHQFKAVDDSLDGRVACYREPIILPSYVQELGEIWESLQFGGMPFAGPKFIPSRSRKNLTPPLGVYSRLLQRKSTLLRTTKT